MTFAEVIADVTAELDDIGMNFFTSEDLEQSLLDGYREVVAITEVIEKQFDLTLVPNQTYYDMKDLISDYLRVSYIYNNQTRKWLDPKSFEYLEQMGTLWELQNGNPTIFCPINPRTLCIYKKPAVAVSPLTVFYKAQANNVFDDGIINIPLEHHHVLTEYMLSDLLDQAQEYVKSGKFFKQYQGSLEAMKQFVRNRTRPDITKALQPQVG